MNLKKRKKRLGTTSEKWEQCKRYFGYRCAYCGRAGKMTKDHIIPRHYGGGDTVFNIIPACQHCNSSKGKKSFERWFRSRSFYNPLREFEIRRYIFINSKANFYF
jgi:5-methylcytosine-specific restriction endonuclease McrA